MAGMDLHILQAPVLQRFSAAVLVVYALLIAWLSLTPQVAFTAGSDKPLHMGAYGLFMMLATPIALTGPLRRLVLLAAGIFVYGALLEAGQALIPGRQCSGLDLLANGAGVLVAAGMLVGLRGAGASGSGEKILKQ
ncbi:MAG: VanZ family protein [Halieaceae bacterium]|nr:VanZ family protein [Halieaceae bacterium]